MGITFYQERKTERALEALRNLSSPRALVIRDAQQERIAGRSGSWSRTIVATLYSRNAAFWWVFGGALAFLGLVLYVPFLRDVFRFAPLRPIDLAICLAAGVVSIM